MIVADGVVAPILSIFERIFLKSDLKYRFSTLFMCTWMYHSGCIPIIFFLFCLDTNHPFLLANKLFLVS